MGEQYNVSNVVRQNLEAKARRRAELREIFQKQATNPHMHALAEGGTVFDPAIHRYFAMRANMYESFKPSGRNVIIGLMWLTPFIAFGSLMYWQRSTNEHKYRTGQVAYKDRLFKFC